MARNLTADEREIPSRIPSDALIFVVDDKEVLVQFAEAVLQSAGYEVRSFTDPEQTLLAMKESGVKPDLLVTDYDMGGMNGLELIAASCEAHPALKTIMLSGTISESFVNQSDVAVDRFMAKPYQPPKLIGMVADVLRTESKSKSHPIPA
jgi:DNA-binding NtrC family response regulator